MVKICKTILWILLSLSWVIGYAAVAPLPAEQAFPFHIYTNSEKQVIAEWNITPGYYLYKDKMQFSTAPNSQVLLINRVLPAGKDKVDDIRGKYQTYTGNIKIPLTFNSTTGRVILNVSYQGCSSAGYCYLQTKKQFTFDLAKLIPHQDLTKKISAAKLTVSEQDYAKQLLTGHKLFLILSTFLGLGLLLAFTPCVLPMVPILSGIIVDHTKRHHTTTLKAFLLSFSYVAGMALTYMLLGIAVALLGSSIQAEMEKPWVIILLSAFFVVLALSLFGLYTLQFPASWQRHLMKWDKHFKQGTYGGVFLMGCFSSLIVSPCVSAPLVGVLAYIGQTGDVVLGASALLALGIGMGIPLLLIGASINFLPRSGPWMTSIQKIFGLMMLGVAIWLLSRIISPIVSMFLWALLFIISAVILGAFRTAIGRLDKWLKVLGIFSFIYGIVLMMSISFFANTTSIKPWKLFPAYKQQHLPAFKVINNQQELNNELMMAKKLHTPVMVDFSADWCTSCKIIDNNVFANEEVQQILKNILLLRIDLTQNSEADQQLLKSLNVIAPPTVLFFDRNGTELTAERLVGEFNKDQFIQHLQALNFITH
jgi:thiol:disulfide interchange protein DsbD